MHVQEEQVGLESCVCGTTGTCAGLCREMVGRPPGADAAGVRNHLGESSAHGERRSGGRL